MAQICLDFGPCANSPSCCIPPTSTAARCAPACVHLGSLLQPRALASRFRAVGSQAHQVTCHGRSLVARCRADGADVPLLEAVHNIDLEALAAEAPRLLGLCQDLDLSSQIYTLRQEARNGLQNLIQQAIHSYVDSWSHEQVVQGLEEHWTAKPPMPEPLWNAEAAMQDLRLQACRQAVQQLAGDVDSSFDWKTAAMELQLRVRQQSPPGILNETILKETKSSEETLWESWVKANEGMTVADNKLMEDALAVSSDLNGKEQLLHLRAGFQDLTKSLPDLRVAAIAGASIGAATSVVVDQASAAETGLSIYPIPESIEAATRAPSWLGPAVLAFPVVTYLLFNYYRDNVNPGARVIDWMFGVLAAVIIANVVLIATLGVRLY